MRDTRGNRERKKEKERKRERASERQNVMVNREEEEKREAEKETKRVGARREREVHEKRLGRRWKKDVERGARRGRKAVLLMGPLSGLAALCDLQLKSSPSLPAPAALSPRRVICCEFINATLARATIERTFHVSNCSGRAEYSAHVLIQSSF